ncbi:MAG: hypothetical protein R3176_08180 [Woeseiaceae bacterium]|nr:hypothetical protein [Woeseiaceae bacterium]
MIVILLTAGTSKFMSGGSFAAYYADLFQGDLRIRLPAGLVTAYLALIPLIEIGLGLALFFRRVRIVAIHGWFAFMLSLTVGHYVLQEWSAVNDMLDYFLLGLVCLVLPAHDSLLARPAFARRSGLRRGPPASRCFISAASGLRRPRGSSRR